MTENTRKNLVLEDTRLIFRNFAGKEDKYNREGDRNFNVALPKELADDLMEEGWNVKWLTAREEDEPDQAILEVAVNYRGRPPRIVMVTSRGKTPLDEDTVDALDFAEIEKADVILNPYHWNVNGKTGVKAYCQSLFVTIREDELELKYADVEDM